LGFFIGERGLWLLSWIAKVVWREACITRFLYCSSLTIVCPYYGRAYGRIWTDKYGYYNLWTDNECSFFAVYVALTYMRRALRGLENTTPSPVSPSKLKYVHSRRRTLLTGFAMRSDPKGFSEVSAPLTNTPTNRRSASAWSKFAFRRSVGSDLITRMPRSDRSSSQTREGDVCV